ncbi:hypothetical protein B4102_2283 [Heyndrickxia sporothermodurans]|uniref:HTH cro/C1-type domain-containing protein n=1 Tax=Heyndrickxia sporothermodurans TaxID=46224 RepID=A0A150LGE0_9BACI|nr:helix-turn-helix transcriptional regulator [Heyndrickxia sporothermodurans]KYD11099.1 hypothetical protein B4102_2283 [Heyndrickxia sporothermodurans]
MFQNKIGYWAEERGIKHKRLAKECGVTTVTISKWINNRTQPDLKQSYILARILGIKIDDLVEEEEE